MKIDSKKYFVVGTTCISKPMYLVFRCELDYGIYIRKDTLEYGKVYTSDFKKTVSEKEIKNQRNEFLMLLRNNYNLINTDDADNSQLSAVEREMIKYFFFLYQNFVDMANEFTFEFLVNKFFLHVSDCSATDDKFSLCSKIYERGGFLPGILSKISRSRTSKFTTVRIHQKRVNRSSGLVDRSIVITALVNGRIKFIIFDNKLIKDYKINTNFVSNANGGGMKIISRCIDNDLQANIYAQDQIAMREAIRRAKEGDTMKDLVSYYKEIVHSKNGNLKYYHDCKATYYHKVNESFDKCEEGMIEQVEVTIPVIKYQRSDDEICNQIRKDYKLIMEMSDKAIKDYNDRNPQSQCRKYTMRDLEVSRFIYRSDGVIEITFIPKKG